MIGKFHPWRICIAMVLLSLFGPFAAHADDEQLRVIAGHSEIVFSRSLGVPVSWAVCLQTCESADAKRALLMSADDGYFRVAEAGGQSAEFVAQVSESEDFVEVEFAAADRSRTYRVYRNSARLEVGLPPGTAVAIATGSEFVPEQLPGFGQIYSRVRGAEVSEDGQRLFTDPEESLADLALDGSRWVGIRNQYWALLADSANQSAIAAIDIPQRDAPELLLSPANPARAVSLVFYAGPVHWETLRKVAPELSEMLFAALWDFLRVLCFGMLLLLGWLQSATGSFGLAIVLLSLTNKILLTPLTRMADRWQADVNRIHTLLKPELDAIKRQFKGEEAHMRVLDVYKSHNVSQFYTFKSAAGFLIQIPVFIAAFDMLAENIALSQVAFLWISDLSKPDRLAELPFVLPFFGGWLNILPFLMTGLSVLAAVLQSEESLSPDLQRQQSVRLYLMSAAFFVLFYTFPAGMVLYWTSSNLFHLLKVESVRVYERIKDTAG